MGAKSPEPRPPEMGTREYQAAVVAAADRITLDEGQRAQLAILLKPVALTDRTERHGGAVGG